MSWSRLPVNRIDWFGVRSVGEAPPPRAMPGACIALVCALLVSCGGEARLVPPDELSPTPSAGLPDASPLATPGAKLVTPAIAEIVWVAASDPVTNAPAETVTAYSPQAPRITASALVTALPAGSHIAATWEYNNTSLEAFSREIVLSAPVDQTWISFHIDRGSETAWPAGAYEITISLNGAQKQRSAVAVAIPE